MTPRPAAARRALGLWTAGCLAVLLVLGIARLGDWSLQWPLLVVPLVWALVAVRPSRGERRRAGDDEGDPPSYWDDPDRRDEGKHPYRPQRSERTDTVERPWIRDERGRRQE
jgi:hypothetical protein